VLIRKDAGVRVPWDERLRVIDVKDVLATVEEVFDFLAKAYDFTRRERCLVRVPDCKPQPGDVPAEPQQTAGMPPLSSTRGDTAWWWMCCRAP